MTREQLAGIVLAAVLAFWMIGAYNRLVAMRNVIKQAWARVDDALRLRSDAATPMLQDLQLPLATEAGALAALQTALHEAARCAAAMTQQPLVQAHAQAWVAAEASLGAAASRVFALLEPAPASEAGADLARHAPAWREAHARLTFARQVFNDAATTYDAALTVLPTRWLLPLFSFAPAGRI